MKLVEIALVSAGRRGPALSPSGVRPDEFDGAVGGCAVVAVAEEVLGAELPVGGEDPLVEAEDLHVGVGAVLLVEEEPESEEVVADVLLEGRCVGVPGGPDGALVDVELCDLDEPPLGLVELLVVGLLVVWDADEVAAEAEGPAVVGAGEDGGVALVVAADLHAAVSARVEEDVDLVLAVAGEDDGLLAHARDEVVAGLADLVDEADEEPASGEDAFEFDVVEVGVDEDLAADEAALLVDVLLHGNVPGVQSHDSPPLWPSSTPAAQWHLTQVEC